MSTAPKLRKSRAITHGTAPVADPELPPAPPPRLPPVAPPPKEPFARSPLRRP